MEFSAGRNVQDHQRLRLAAANRVRVRDGPVQPARYQGLRQHPCPVLPRKTRKDHPAVPTHFFVISNFTTLAKAINVLVFLFSCFTMIIRILNLMPAYAESIVIVELLTCHLSRGNGHWLCANVTLFCTIIFIRSWLVRFLGWLLGSPAQFVDPRIIGGTDGREVVRVQSGGKVKVVFNVLSKGHKDFNYDLGGA